MVADLRRGVGSRHERCTLPASRSKNGRAHLVPLSEMALQTILFGLTTRIAALQSVLSAQRKGCRFRTMRA